MTRRLDIPWLVDLLLVDDPALMSRLNEHPNIGRRLVRSRRWVNEWFRAHIESHMRVGETLLPVFVGPDPPSSRVRQKELAARFDKCAAGGLPEHAEDVRLLADYVAGGPETEVGVIVQRIIGRMFRPDYTATPESYQAGGTVAVSQNPFFGTFMLWTGRLPRAISRVWSLAGNDPHCIHSTAVAMPNVVATVHNMRKGFARGGSDRQATASDAIRKYLHVPPLLLRSCSGDTQVAGLSRPLRSGTMVMFQLARAVAASGDIGRAFARGEWNECPSSRASLVLLEQVWEGARRARGKELSAALGAS